MEILRKFRHAIPKSGELERTCGGWRMEDPWDSKAEAGKSKRPPPISRRGNGNPRHNTRQYYGRSQRLDRPSEWLAETETNRRATYIIFTPKCNRRGEKPQGENYERQHTATTNDFASEFAANNLHKSIFNHPKRGSSFASVLASLQ